MGHEQEGRRPLLQKHPAGGELRILLSLESSSVLLSLIFDEGPEAVALCVNTFVRSQLFDWR